ncbi:complement component receptor 1-like protein, partial [Clarias magur]
MLSSMVIFSVILMTAVNAQEINCNSPSIPNAYFNGNAQLYKHGDKIQIGCHQGHRKEGPDYLTCEEHGWNPSLPLCIKITCKLPPIPNADFSGNAQLHEYGEKIQIRCYRGYRKVGPDSLTCGDHGWNPSLPQCIEIKCDPPPSLYMIITGRESSYRYDDQIQIRCKENYRQEGPEYLSCRDHGWDPFLPRCTEITCDSPLIKNAVVSGSSAPYKYGISVQITCDKGYKIDRIDYMTCGKHGWNLSLPQCIGITCNSPSIPNAVINGSSPRYKYGVSVQIRCTEGYRIEGSDYLTCGENGWNSSLPQCIDRRRLLIPIIIGTVVTKVIILVVVGVALFWWMKNRECK